MKAVNILQQVCFVFLFIWSVVTFKNLKSDVFGFAHWSFAGPQSNGTPLASSMSKCANSPAIVTPSQLISNKTPSTQELYQALKLVPDGGDCLNR